TTRHTARGKRRTAHRNRAPAASRREEGRFREARLLRHLASGARAHAGACDLGDERAPHSIALEDIRAKIPRGDEGAGETARAHAAGRAVQANESLSGLL